MCPKCLLLKTSVASVRCRFSISVLIPRLFFFFFFFFVVSVVTCRVTDESWVKGDTGWKRPGGVSTTPDPVAILLAGRPDRIEQYYLFSDKLHRKKVSFIRNKTILLRQVKCGEFHKDLHVTLVGNFLEDHVILKIVTMKCMW